MGCSTDYSYSKGPRGERQLPNSSCLLSPFSSFKCESARVRVQRGIRALLHKPAGIDILNPQIPISLSFSFLPFSFLFFFPFYFQCLFTLNWNTLRSFLKIFFVGGNNGVCPSFIPPTSEAKALLWFQSRMTRFSRCCLDKVDFPSRELTHACNAAT